MMPGTITIIIVNKEVRRNVKKVFEKLFISEGWSKQIKDQVQIEIEHHPIVLSVLYSSTK